jgi:hypothetical protein
MQVFFEYNFCYLLIFFLYCRQILTYLLLDGSYKTHCRSHTTGHILGHKFLYIQEMRYD